MGTPAYMSPEQAMGLRDSLCPASDVFSLGTVLYETFSGDSPFVFGQAPQTLMAIIGHDPKPLRQVNPEVPKDLETVIMKCLAKSIDDHYPDANELAADLTRLLEHKPVLARPIGKGEWLLRWTRRNRALVGALVAVIVVLMVVLVVVLESRLEREQAAATVAELTRNQEQQAERVAEAVAAAALDQRVRLETEALDELYRDVAEVLDRVRSGERLGSPLISGSRSWRS